MLVGTTKNRVKQVVIMKILAFAASNSKTSINRQLVQYAMSLLKDGVLPATEFELIDLNDFEMPIYRPDREEEGGIPDQARRLYQKIGNADAVLVSFAEHNGNVTAAWKNIFDWMSRIDMKVWQGRPLVMLAASPGSRGGQGVLQSQSAVLPHFGGELKGSAGIGDWYDAWDADTGRLTRTEDLDALTSALAGLA